MSYIDLPNKEDLQGVPREMVEDSENRWGYIPNIVRAYSLAPNIMEAEEIWSRTVMREGILDRKLKEEIATVVSSTNEVDYCASSHAHAIALAGGTEDEAKQCKLLDFDKFNQAERAAFEFAHKATVDYKSINQEDMDKLKAHYTNQEIIEITTVIQQFMGYNCFVTILGLELEDANPMRTV